MVKYAIEKNLENESSKKRSVLTLFISICGPGNSFKFSSTGRLRVIILKSKRSFIKFTHKMIYITKYILIPERGQLAKCSYMDV